MDNNSIDVVIPVHNRPQELDRALASLSAQHDRNFGVIVCDDGSSEDLSGVIGRWERVLRIDFVRIQPFGGPARPRNVGVSRSSATWVSFLDSDDWWFPQRISRLREVLSGDADVVYHPLRIDRGMNRRSSWLRRSGVVGLPVRGTDVVAHMIRRGNPVATSGATVRRDALLSVNGFREQIDRISVEDFDCWLRLAARGRQFKFLPDVLGGYWFGGGNISVNAPLQYWRYRMLFEQQLQELPSRYVSEANSHFNYVLGIQAAKLGLQDQYTHFAQVRPRFGLSRWIKSRWMLASYLHQGIFK
jgi:glycosyltransferase involved in cell wall biosynthesis